MRRVGGDVDCRSRANDLRRAAKGEFELAIQQREHLLEIMPVRRRPASSRNQHIDQAIAPGGLRARYQHRIDVADHADARQTRIVRSRQGQLAREIVGGDVRRERGVSLIWLLLAVQRS